MRSIQPRRSSQTDTDYDVIVVGSRAAGASTAMLLARQGYRTLLVDRRQPGSDTLSTHALMRAGVFQLHRWGLLDRIIAAGTPAVKRTVFHYGDDVLPVEITPSEGVPALYAPRRTLLDATLADAAEAAGATVEYSLAVEGLLRDEGGRVVGIRGRRNGKAFEATARMTVGADGVNSKVAEAVGSNKIVEGKDSVAVVYSHWQGDFPADYDFYYRPGVSAGVIPTNDGEANFWVAIHCSRFRSEMQGDLESAFHRFLAEGAPEALQLLEGARRQGRYRGFPGVPGFIRQAWGPGWALVGDASHFKDPLSAHGITDALRDAEFLARSIGRCLNGEPERIAMTDYQNTRDRLSTDMHEVADLVASFNWDINEVKDLLIRMSRAMGPEMEALRDLDSLSTAA